MNDPNSRDPFANLESRINKLEDISFKAFRLVIRTAGIVITILALS